MKQISRTAYVKDDGMAVAVLNPDTGLLELLNVGWAAQALLRELGHAAFRKDLVFEAASKGAGADTGVAPRLCPEHEWADDEDTDPVPRLRLEHAWADDDGEPVTFFSSTKLRLRRPCPQLVRTLGTKAFITEEHLLESCRIIVSEDYRPRG